MKVTPVRLFAHFGVPRNRSLRDESLKCLLDQLPEELLESA